MFLANTARSIHPSTHPFSIHPSILVGGVPDLIDSGAEGVHTEPGSTVHVVGGDSFFYTVNEAESLKGEAGGLLLSVDSHHCLDVPVTPGRDATGCLNVLLSSSFIKKNNNHNNRFQLNNLALS